MTLRRDEIMGRARLWASTPRRYSQEDCDPETGYRLDCSGYVSMVWGLDPPGLTTVELPDLCRLIDPHELLPGDVLMVGGPGTEGDAGHAILFDTWDDRARRRVLVYEQTGSVGTVHRVIDYPAPPYLAYRHRDVGPDAGSC
jgi:hypothetical protein